MAGFSFGGAPAAPAPGGGAPAPAAPAAASGGFSFGAGAAAPAPPGGAPPAAAASAPAAGGGFGFGAAAPAAGAPAAAPSAPAFGAAPAPTAAAAAAPTAAAPGAPAPAAGGFSFGAAAPGAPAAPAAPAFGATPAPAAVAAPGAPTPAAPPPAAGGLSFGGAPAPAAPTAPGAAPAPAAFGAAPTAAPGAATAPAPAPGAPAAAADDQEQRQPTLVVPHFRKSFPGLRAHDRVVDLVARISSGGNETHGSNGAGPSLEAQELIHLLRCDAPAAAASGGGGNAQEGDAPIGKLLSNPKPVSRAASDETLRTNLNNNPYVRLHGKVTGMSRAMLEEVVTLSDDLKVTIEDACCLTAGAGDAGTRRWLERTVGRSFVDAALAADEASAALAAAHHITPVDHSGANAAHVTGASYGADYGATAGVGGGLSRPAPLGSAGGGTNKIAQKLAARRAQKAAAMGAASGAAVHPASGAFGSPMPVAGAVPGAAPMGVPPQPEFVSKIGGRSPLDPLDLGNDVPRASRELYFHERSRALSALLALMRRRVEASDALLGSGEDGMTRADARAVLMATDQLLNDGLVDNLIALMRDLTREADECARRMAEAEKAAKEAQQQRAAQAAAAAAMGAYGAPAPAAGFGGFGSPPPAATAFGAPPAAPAFGAAAQGAPGAPNNGDAQKPRGYDLEPVHLAFALRQRQLAADALFYVCYGTQLTSGEVASLLDLVRDLTNGTGDVGEKFKQGVGCGLKVLDPIKDAPDAWMVDAPHHDVSNAASPGMMGGAMPGAYGGQQYPQQQAGLGGMFSPSSGGYNATGAVGQAPSAFGQAPSAFGAAPNPYAPAPAPHPMNAAATAAPTFPGQPPQPHATGDGQPHEKGVELWREEFVADAWRLRDHDNGQNGMDVGGVGGVTGSASGALGRPHLLRCSGTVVLSVLCALESGHVLMDRDLHGPNGFGAGNALLPPPSESGAVAPLDALSPVHSRLDPGSTSTQDAWRRQDILGLLSAAFGLLLRPSAAVLASPKTGGRSPTGAGGSSFSFSTPQQPRRGGSSSASGGAIDVKASFRSCLEIPVINKSLTFARTSLLPSLGSPSYHGESDTAASSSTSGGLLSSHFSFCASVLSDFTARYLDAVSAIGELPISRAEWLADEEKELELKRRQQEQYGAWAGATASHTAPLTPAIPDAVDLTKRPDCMDDVLALVAEVCTACPECAGQFWSTTELVQNPEDSPGDGNGRTVKIVPSRFLKKLDRLRAEDQSLLPSFLTFLSALTLVGDPDPQDNNSKKNKKNDGALAVHLLLTSKSGPTGPAGLWSPSSSPSSPGAVSASQHRPTWPYLLESIRWYADLLSTAASGAAGAAPGGARGSPARGFDSDGRPSTAYYYGAESNAVEGGRGFVHAASSDTAHQTGSAAGAGPAAPQHLGEADAIALASMLDLLGRAALRCPDARDEILSVRLSIPGAPTAAFGGGGGPEDDALTILFSLALQSVSPEVRGLTFVAIANLIRCEDSKRAEDEDQIGDAQGHGLQQQGHQHGHQQQHRTDWGMRGWQMLEASQILPINTLSQYPSPDAVSNAAGMGAQMQYGARSAAAGLASQHQSSASVPSTSASAWLPPSTEYGLLHELEHVEAHNGVYPSTEGFLYLLAALIHTSGCPPSLGAPLGGIGGIGIDGGVGGPRGRGRPGCAPYVEYVTSFVLPRAMGGTRTDDEGLYFATPGDKSRLIARALEVVELALVRYVVPPPAVGSNRSSGGQQTIAQRQIGSNASAVEWTTSADPLAMPPSRLITHHEQSVSNVCETRGLSPVRDSLCLGPGNNDADGGEYRADEVKDSVLDFCDVSASSAATAAMQQQPHTRNALGGPVAVLGATSSYAAAGQGQNTAAAAMMAPQMMASTSSSPPRAKSPGFAVLSSLLSSGGGSLFRVLSAVLREHGQVGGLAEYEKECADALFGDTPPDYTTQRGQGPRNAGFASLGTSTGMLQGMLRPLAPPVLHASFLDPDDDDGDKSRYVSTDDAVTWRELTVLLSLRLLCLAASREESFARALHARGTGSPLTITPVLRFKAPVRGHISSGGLQVRDVEVSRLVELLLESPGRSVYIEELVPILARYVGYQPQALRNEGDVARAAISLVSFVARTVPHRECVAALCGRSKGGAANLAGAFAMRLLMPSFESNNGGSCGDAAPEKDAVDPRHIILDLILSSLALHTAGDDEGKNLGLILLGLGGDEAKSSSRKKMMLLRRSSSIEGAKYDDCLNAALYLISKANFTRGQQTSSLASKCYELVYRLASSSDVTNVKLPVLLKLRSTNFWIEHLSTLLGMTTSIGEQQQSTLGFVAACAASSSETGPGLTQPQCDHLHSIAWLLRGAAIELHSLMGGLSLAPNTSNSNQDPGLSDLQAALAPQPTQCRKLLSYLLAQPYYAAIQTLMELPINRPAFTLGLESGCPSQALIQSAVKVMDGPVDVCGGHRVVDAKWLLGQLREQGGNSASSNHRQESGSPNANVASSPLLPLYASTDQEKAAIKWAQSWNLYASYSCSSSHLARAWETLLGSALVGCHSLIFNDDASPGLSSGSNEGGLMNRESLVELARLLLSRLVVDELQQASGTTLEDASALPLSIAALRLVSILNDMDTASSAQQTQQGGSAPVEDASGVVVAFDEERSELAGLIAAAIAACAQGSGAGSSLRDERAAVLSCALSAVLQGSSGPGDKFSLDERHAYLNAAIHLADAAAIRSGRSNGAASQSEKEKAISVAVRCGLTAVISHFDRIERTEDQFPGTVPFLVQLFGSEASDHSNQTGGGRLARLVALLTAYDTDVPHTLEKIATCKHGTALLLGAGAMNALLAATSQYSSDIYGPNASLFDGVNREGSYGSVFQAPPFLGGHLSLLNTMLSSSDVDAGMASSSQKQMVSDAARLIQAYSITGDALLRNFPRDGDVATKFLTCLYLTSIAAANEEDRSTFGSSSASSGALGFESLLDDRLLNLLDGRVLNLAYHISEYPFPPHLLPPVPVGVSAVERARIASQQGQHIAAVASSEGGSWWDAVNGAANATTGALPLPDPPTGSASAGARWDWSAARSSEDRSNGNAWSNQKYTHAIAGARCLEACLSYLASRAEETSASSFTPAFDFIALSKGLCRCSDAARAIEERLRGLQLSKDADITKMLGQTSFASQALSNGATALREVERRPLSTLGPILGRCASTILLLAERALIPIAEASVVPRGAPSTMSADAKAEIVGAISPALEHTQVESLGISCVSDASDGGADDFTRNVASTIRGALEKIAGSV